MATPITKTWLQMQLMSGGSTCAEIQTIATAMGLTDSSNVDALTWNDAVRTANLEHLAWTSIVREMSPAQRKLLVIWGLQQFQSNLPVGWAHTSAISTKIDEIIDCLNNPSPAKRTALQTFASSIVIDYSDLKDKFIRQQMKRICNLVANQVSDHVDVKKTLLDLSEAAIRITGVSFKTIHGAILTKVEQIIGIRD